MAKTIEQKKVELEEKRKKIEAKLADTIKKQKESLKDIVAEERALLLAKNKADRVSRNRAMYLLAGFLLEDMKKNNDVAAIEKYNQRVTSAEDKEKFKILIEEVKVGNKKLSDDKPKAAPQAPAAPKPLSGQPNNPQNPQTH